MQIQELDLKLQSKTIQVAIRYSAKSKNISIRILKVGKVELVIPSYRKLEKAKEFLISKTDWLNKKINQIEDIAIPENQIPIFGKFYEIEHQDSDKTLIIIDQDKLLVTCPTVIKNDVIRRYLKNTITTEIIKIASEIAAKHEFTYKNIKINSTKTKWGSCSSDKKLKFNWRLVFAPHNVIYYLVAHELCHLKEMNHSPKFWQLVAEVDPNYKASRLWLKKNSFKLHSYISELPT